MCITAYLTKCDCNPHVRRDVHNILILTIPKYSILSRELVKDLLCIFEFGTYFLFFVLHPFGLIHSEICKLYCISCIFKVTVI